MKRFVFLAGLCLAMICNTSSAARLSQGDIVLNCAFEGTNPLAGWSGSGKLEEGCQSRNALVLSREPGSGRESATVSLALNPVDLRGCTIRGSAMVKAENVSVRPNPWNGIKMMLAIETPDRKLWPQADVGVGTFDWSRLALYARIPTDATRVSLVLGLEEVTGKVWFDNLKFAVAKAPIVSFTTTPAAEPFRGHPLPRLRGAMIAPNIDAEGLRTFGKEWNANLIRWQLIRHGQVGQRPPLETYDEWLEGELKKVDDALPLCERYGLYVALDLHSPPGGKTTSSGYVGSDDGLFTDKKCQDKFVEVWRKMAARYKNARAIWGFDLANEPVETLVEEGCADWQELAERAARAVRAIDPHRTLIVEPTAWGGPDGLNDLVPLSVSNVVYSVHMYLPHAFTHQGVGNRGPAYLYPGVIQGQQWNKARLEEALQPVVDFQKRYGVHIYIGEFSAIRWAPDNSAARYLADVIDIFEAQGWDWSYHAFREWSGWSVEHGPDRQNTARTSQPTDRQKLLRQWFSRNQKPAWIAGP